MSLKFLDQLYQTDQTKKSHVKVGRPKAIHRADEKLFLCVFYGINKNLKRKNQFDVAIEITKLFDDAFPYFSYSSYDSFEEYNIAFKLRMDKLKLAIGVNDNSFNHYLISKKHNYSGAYERALYDLSEYFKQATPAAIVQMRKRLLLKNQCLHLISKYR